MEVLIPREKQASPLRHRQTAFRNRGFRFRKQAGTRRITLSRWMWRASLPDRLRLVSSVLLRIAPCLKPRPMAATVTDEMPYRYTIPVQDPENFSFILAGDTGMNSPGEYLVSTAISRQDLYPSEFCLLLGDVVYPAGGEASYRFGLLEAFKYYPAPIIAIPGNHDWYDNLRAYRRFFIQNHKLPQSARDYGWRSPDLPNWYFAMDFGRRLRIICLDTGLDGNLDKPQLAWLDKALSTAGLRKVVIACHHPLYSLNSRGHEAKLRKLLEPRFQSARVAGIFSGHDHSYQRHTINGTTQIIQGAGGATLQDIPPACEIRTSTGQTHRLTDTHSHGRQFSFTRCHWKNGRLTGTTVSAHQLPGRILDQFDL